MLLYVVLVKEEKRAIWELVGAFGPGSIVGIATGYGLDGPGIES